MSCPFSRGFSRTKLNDDCSTVDESNDNSNIGNSSNNSASGSGVIIKTNRNDRFKPCRQSSVQITSSLLGEEIDDQEETQTLNLKHLRAAVIVLTNPSVRNFYVCILGEFEGSILHE
ncbi:hypothetical protein PV328_011897 [Microctonus aethiopoides]|uniref:Uncharacterized protein n=1 Tax=Microctonus aethiopoides TaxID=144406 RepID=A0AA39FHI2_9HYME|nr:hypothetical protein PV328_011897 [Microctonus aethiopoides]